MEINIGAALKEHRESKRLTLSQLSRECGISRQNLSRWEENIVIPNVVSCIQLAKFYGITLDELLSLD